MRVEIDGDALRKLRQLKQVTNADLARSVGMTPPGLCHVEQGRRRSVTAEVYTALVRALDIHDRPDWILPPVEVDLPLQRSSSPSGLPSGSPSGSIGPRSISVTRSSAA